MYVEVEKTANVLQRVCDIVPCSTVAANLECENDNIYYGHTCENSHTDK